MKKMEISKTLGQIDPRFVQEAAEPEHALARKTARNAERNEERRNGKNEERKSGKKAEQKTARYRRLQRTAAGAGIAVLAFLLAAGAAFAASETFRREVVSFFYPLYATEEIKELEQGHRTGAFDEQDTLLSFLDHFNAEKLEFGVRAEKKDGYAYSMVSDSPDTILAIVDCNISGYKLLVTMRRTAYEETTGIWQTTAYQVITEREADRLVKNTPKYIPQEAREPDTGEEPSDSVIRADGGAIIYRAEKKEQIVALTEEESARVAEIFQSYPETDAISATGLQDHIVKLEDIMYAFSDNGYAIVMEGDGVSVPRGQIVLRREDLKELTELFEKYGL